MINRRGFVAVLCAFALCASAALAGCSSAETYAPSSKEPVITVPTIGEEGVLRVGVNASNPPLAGMPASSERIVGIDVDVAATLADELGLKLEIVDVGTNPASALEQGTVDIVMGIDESNTDAAIWKSDPYLPTATALFSTTQTSAPGQGSTQRIAAAMSSESSWAVTNAYGDALLTAASDLAGAFEMLESGEVPFAAADAVNGIYSVHANDGSAQIVALFGNPGGYTVGVLDTNSALKQAVSDALNAITSNGLVSVVEQKWLGTAVDLSGYEVITAVAPTEEPEEGEEGENENADQTDTGNQVDTGNQTDTGIQTGTGNQTDTGNQADTGNQTGVI